MTKDERVRDTLLGTPAGNEGWWPGLSDAGGGRATKRQANAFMLGAIMDYQMDADTVWKNAESLSEKLGDPDDLWGAIARKPEGEFAMLFRGPPALHRFVNRIPKRVQRISNDIVRKYGGDARRIWEGQPTGEIMQRLKDMHVGEQISRMIRGALYDTGQVEGKGELKADIHVRRVLGRVYEGCEISADGALTIANRLMPDDSWRLDWPLYITGKRKCTKGKPLCDKCPLRTDCIYAS